ncbi:MAG: hypothetical protein IPK11_17610 [Ignavibacteria bacterium]|nr:hypothetical protein [Ignavibacteria bacterium]
MISGCYSPELLGGKALSIGDSFEKVEKVEKLRELRYEAGRDFWGRKRYTKGKYEGIDTKYIQHAFLIVVMNSCQ